MTTQTPDSGAEPGNPEEKGGQFRWRGFSSIARWMALFGAAVLGIMMLVTVVDVGGRYIFLKPVKGADEIVGALLIIAVTWGFAWCEVNQAHISIDFITRRLAPKVQKVIFSFARLVSLVIFSIITWRFFVHALNLMDVEGEVSAMLGIPWVPLLFAASIAFGIFTIAILVNLVKGIRGV